MRKVKKLFTLLTALYMSLMLPVQVMAAVDLNTKYEVDTNKIQGWPQAADIASDTGILMDADTNRRSGGICRCIRSNLWRDRSTSVCGNP